MIELRKVYCTNSKAKFMTSQGWDPREAVRAVAKRILSLQREGEPDAEFARRIGMTRQAVHAYKRKGSGASLEAVLNAARRTGVSLHWLVTGQHDRQGHGSDLRNYGRHELAQEVFELIRGDLTSIVEVYDDRDEKGRRAAETGKRVRDDDDDPKRARGSGGE